MNPWLLGGVGAALLAYFASQASSATPSAGQQSMQFNDYQWTTVLPLGSETIAQQQLPPPPGQVAGSGQWVEHPRGYTFGTVTGPHVPGGKGTVWFPVFPSIPPGYSVYAWRPTKNVLTTLNGYAVMNAGGWKFSKPDNVVAAMGGKADATFPNEPLIHLDHMPGPPPGQLPTSGGWHMVAPGYLVWLTPQNVNSGVQASQLYNNPALVAALAASPYSSAAQGALGNLHLGDSLTPQQWQQLAAASAAAAQPGGAPIPPPSPTPIAVTPPPAAPPATGTPGLNAQLGNQIPYTPGG